MTKKKFNVLFHESLSAIVETSTSLICWMLYFPLSCLVKRDTKLTLVISRKGFFFADNSKYFFVYAIYKDTLIVNFHFNYDFKLKAKNSKSYMAFRFEFLVGSIHKSHEGL